jgi:glycosyltransferase involved in cell wall biosynthesis
VLVHDGIYLTSIVAAIAARVHRRPLVVVQHIGEVPYRSVALRFLMRLANRMFAATMLRVADRVVFISALTQNHFSGLKLRRPPERIYNGIETRVFHPTPGLEKSNQRRALDLPVDAKIVLFVGRFVEKKGLHIIERIARDAPHLLFVFAGWGPMDPAQWGLPNVRVFRNLRGMTLAPLYQASDVLLLPSVGEGFPLVIQEALACGLPVVCGADTAVADPAASAFVNGVELDVPVEAASAAAGAAVEAALSEGDSQGASQMRADFAARHYSWDSVIDRYEHVLTSLMQTEPAPTSPRSAAR